MFTLLLFLSVMGGFVQAGKKPEKTGEPEKTIDEINQKREKNVFLDEEKVTSLLEAFVTDMISFGSDNMQVEHYRGLEVYDITYGEAQAILRQVSQLEEVKTLGSGSLKHAVIIFKGFVNGSDLPKSISAFEFKLNALEDVIEGMERQAKALIHDYTLYESYLVRAREFMEREINKYPIEEREQRFQQVAEQRKANRAQIIEILDGKEDEFKEAIQKPFCFR